MEFTSFSQRTSHVDTFNPTIAFHVSVGSEETQRLRQHRTKAREMPTSFNILVSGVPLRFMALCPSRYVGVA